MNKYVFHCLPLIFIVLSTFLFISGCARTEIRYYTSIESQNNNEYNTCVSSNESLVNFSFKYPSSYILSDATQGNVNPSLYVGLNDETYNGFFHGIVKRMKIHVTNYSSKWLGFPEAKTAMNEQISEYKWSLNRNFRLLQKHKAVVDGVEGWEIVITYRERPAPNIGHGEPRVPIFVVARDVFLDYQGMTWQISLYTDANSYEQQTKADFEHVLQTFKFGE